MKARVPAHLQRGTDKTLDVTHVNRSLMRGIVVVDDVPIVKRLRDKHDLKNTPGLFDILLDGQMENLRSVPNEPRTPIE